MSDKFKYAPGKPGFGSKGDDGSVGSQGLAMYFTDLDPNAGGDSFILNDKIRNNIVLWQSSVSPLPGGRTYMVGDLFFDSDGKTYEITNTTTGTYEYRLASLNTGGFFVPLGITTNNGFQRYFNSNLSPKYIIDNVYTESGAVNYTESPLTIYGIYPKNFARVEYSNVSFTVGPNQYNPFTVYSSGRIAGMDDASSIAIVRDNIHNSFRIGNLDDAGNIRNVNLIFDVSSLIHTKQPGNYFNLTTPAGSILTNYEINANPLFDPNFNSSPASFTISMGSSSGTINWNKFDFTGDLDVDGDLYFYEELGPFTSATFRIDSSAARPLIFSNISSSGSIIITGLSNTKIYKAYIKLSKNGWTRNSDIKTAFNGKIYVEPLSSFSEPSIGHITGFDVSANGAWTVEFPVNPGSFLSVDSSSIVGGGNFDGSINVSLSQNAGTTRNGTMKVTVVGGVSQTVPISQLGAITPVIYEHFAGIPHYTSGFYTADTSCESTIVASGMPGTTVVNISLLMTSHLWNFNDFNNVQYNNFVRVSKAGGGLDDYSFIGNVAPGDEEELATTLSLTNLTASDFPLKVFMYASAQSDVDVPDTFSFNDSLQTSTLTVTYVSGPSISPTYSDFPFTIMATNN